MADNDNLVLEILKKLQAGQADLRRDVQAMRDDLMLELHAIRQHQLGQHADDMAQHERLTALEKRLARVERRLEIVDDD